MIAPDAKGGYTLQHDIPLAAVAQLQQAQPIAKLSLTQIPLVTVRLARRLAGLQVEHLWLWSTVTRRAMRHLVLLPGLQVLDVLHIKGPGTLAHFRKAQALQVFRANHSMSEADLLEAAQCASLTEVGAQGAELSPRVLAALLALPGLTTLDLESTRFDDRMARRLSRSTTIKSLDVGGTRLTRAGLEHLVRMQQLQSLDLWATPLTEADLPLLLGLPKLEYLSLGNHEGLPQLDAEKVTQLILGLPSLKRVWLDGIALHAPQRQALEARLDTLRLT